MTGEGAVEAVGETYFFRQPDHFQFLHDALCRERPARVSAWSAGCATGEEAYSLAATVLAALPGAEVEVLGTDLLERSLLAARAASYGAWSLRPAGPLLFPLLLEGAPGAPRVAERVRRVTRFEQGDLRGPPPGGPFDLIFCRNVLLYFAPDEAVRAAALLASALAPGGLLVFGPLDLPAPPPGLRREGRAELQIFRRVQAVQLKPHSTSTQDRARPPPEPPTAIHRRALALLEASQLSAAQALLEELRRSEPHYLPGLLELGLLLSRRGLRRRAAELLREVLQRADASDPEQLVDAPEPLPARFFAAAARAFLERKAQ